MNKFSLKDPKKVREQILAYLTSEEDDEIRYLVRLNIMLLISQPDGPNTQQVADLYGMSRSTVGKWVQKLNSSEDMDITVLRQAPKPGRATRMDDSLRDTIKKVLAKPPKKAAVGTSKWTGQLLSDYLKTKYSIELKPRMCQRWMRRFALEKEQAMEHSGKLGS